MQGGLAQWRTSKGKRIENWLGDGKVVIVEDVWEAIGGSSAALEVAWAVEQANEDKRGQAPVPDGDDAIVASILKFTTFATLAYNVAQNRWVISLRDG